MSSLKSKLAAAACLLALAPAGQAAAQSTEDVGVEILQLLVDEGVLSADKAQGLLDRAKRAAELRTQRDAPASASTVDVPYVPEIVRLQIRDEVKADLVAEAKAQRWIAPGKVPAWVDRVSLEGDVRLRYEGNFFGDNFPYFPDVNAINRAGGVTDAEGFPLLNSTVDRHRMRYRMRLGINANVTDRVRVGVRLASGNDAGAVSTNETLGDYFDKDSFWIDRAFIAVTPLDGLTLVGGRMPNPFVSTDMVWDEDVNPEGVAVTYGHSFEGLSFRPKAFATAGAFPLRERAENDEDRWLYAGQVGGEFTPMEQLSFAASVAYYDFENVQSRKDPPGGSRLYDYTAPDVLSQGNSVFNMRTDGLTTLAGLASDFDLLNVTASGVWRGFDPVQVKVTADYVKNLAFDRNEVARLRGEPGVGSGDTGWQVLVDVGHPKLSKRHDWQVTIGYKSIETDAVLDIFTDSDFGLGGTDVQGYYVKAGYGIYDNTSVSVNWFSTDSIERPPFAVDVLQLNLNAKF